MLLWKPRPAFHFSDSSYPHPKLRIAGSRNAYIRITPKRRVKQPMTRTRQTPNRLISLAASCMAIFWPGAFIFGFPGIMAPYWQKTFHVGRGEVGRTLFFLLAAVGTFMLVSGRLQERVRPRNLVLFGSVLCGSSMFLAGTAKRHVHDLCVGLPDGNFRILYPYSGAFRCATVVPAKTRVCLGYGQFIFRAFRCRDVAAYRSLDQYAGLSEDDANPGGFCPVDGACHIPFSAPPACGFGVPLREGRDLLQGAFIPLPCRRFCGPAASGAYGWFGVLQAQPALLPSHCPPPSALPRA